MSKTVGTATTQHWYDETGLTLDTGATAATYLRDQGGSLLSLNTGGQTYSYARDRLGSVRGLVSMSTGQLERSYTYTPYGYLHRSTGSVAQPFMFTAAYQDSSAYHLMGQRYYHQPTGRFTQLDPLPKKLLTPNRYEYAGSNPCNFTDPLGLDHCSALTWVGVSFNLVASIGGVVGGAIAVVAAGAATGPLAPLAVPAAWTALLTAEAWYISALAFVGDCYFN